jgi:hypothetical protein
MPCQSAAGILTKSDQHQYVLNHETYHRLERSRTPPAAVTTRTSTLLNAQAYAVVVNCPYDITAAGGARTLGLT